MAEELIELGSIRRSRRMGAEELIELGDRPAMIGNTLRFFMANPRMARLGFFAEVGIFIAGAFETVFNLLADIVGGITDLVGGGIGALLTGTAGLLGNIPIIGGILSQVVLLANTVIQFALSIPETLLRNIGSVFTSLKKLMEPEKNQDTYQKAKDDVVKKAPSGIQKDVEKMLGASLISLVTGKAVSGAGGAGSASGGSGGAGGAGGSPIGGGEMPEGGAASALNDVLMYGVPAAAAAVAIAAVAIR